ncbi:MaoC family dehydratase N-terminal domain-containing protein [Chloroflexota bacterium]
MTQDMYEELQMLIGQEGPLITGPDLVCKAMIRHWCEAMEDANPLYADEQYATRSKYGSIISPPMMIQSWSMAPLWPDGQELQFRHPEKVSKTEGSPNPAWKANRILANAGYIGTVVTDNTFEFFGQLFPGDKAIVSVRLSDISPEKETSRGNGHFITTTRTTTNQNGELICKQSFTLFKFKPPPK